MCCARLRRERSDSKAAVKALRSQPSAHRKSVPSGPRNLASRKSKCESKDPAQGANRLSAPSKQQGCLSKQSKMFRQCRTTGAGRRNDGEFSSRTINQQWLEHLIQFASFAAVRV